jgi:hypothetical protein
LKYEIENGDYLGTAEWRGPGQVELDMPDGKDKRWLQRFFEGRDSVMGGAAEPEGMTLERRDESEAAFNRAAYQLAAYSYKVRLGDGRRNKAHDRQNA